jgi:sulfane dehydrogenase subunit SoxC
MTDPGDPWIPVAGNGLLHRRWFLQGALGVAMGLPLSRAAATAPSFRPPWASAPGGPLSGYGTPSPYEGHVQRIGLVSQPGTDGSGASRTPLEHLEGVITPNGLCFERHHSGVPEIDPQRHGVVVHGRVRRPLRFSVAALHRYPLVTRTLFLECSGNSAGLLAADAQLRTCGELHGLVSASEYTGVPLALLLDEAGVEDDARWVVAEGGDAALMSRSVPLAKALDDALLVLYQNGERLRPENGYPVRLLLPGYEGNMSIKWLKRLHVTSAPAMARNETSKYTDLRPDGTADQFTFPMAVKSVITSPSPGLSLVEPGLYQISGLAWSGRGTVRRVEVSADGGRSWAEAALDEPARPLSLNRFRAAWRWNGGPAVLISRASDDHGDVQPTRDAWLARHGVSAFYHCNAMQAWGIDARGEVRNVYL